MDLEKLRREAEMRYGAAVHYSGAPGTQPTPLQTIYSMLPQPPPPGNFRYTTCEPHIISQEPLRPRIEEIIDEDVDMGDGC